VGHPQAAGTAGNHHSPKGNLLITMRLNTDFATIGRCIMLLNARQIQRVLGRERIILLAIEDITERKEIENGLEKTRKSIRKN